MSSAGKFKFKFLFTCKKTYKLQIFTFKGSLQENLATFL